MSIMFNLKQFFRKRREQRQVEQFEAGYAFAAGELLRKGLDCAGPWLQNYVECAIDFNEYSDYDRGIEAAIEAHKRLVYGI